MSDLPSEPQTAPQLPTPVTLTGWLLTAAACGTEIGLPGGADFAVGPGEAGGPFNRIVSIPHFPDESVIFLPFGTKNARACPA
jgi:hypothetical protein